MVSLLIGPPYVQYISYIYADKLALRLYSSAYVDFGVVALKY